MPPTSPHDGRISQRDVDSGTGLDGPPIDGLGGGGVQRGGADAQDDHHLVGRRPGVRRRRQGDAQFGEVPLVDVAREDVTGLGGLRGHVREAALRAFEERRVELLHLRGERADGDDETAVTERVGREDGLGRGRGGHYHVGTVDGSPGSFDRARRDPLLAQRRRTRFPRVAR